MSMAKDVLICWRSITGTINNVPVKDYFDWGGGVAGHLCLQMLIMRCMLILVNITRCQSSLSVNYIIYKFRVSVCVQLFFILSWC